MIICRRAVAFLFTHEPISSCSRLQQGVGASLMLSGRIPVSCGVEGRDVRKEEMPAGVAPEGFEAEQGFIAGAAPELAGALEAALVLAAGA